MFGRVLMTMLAPAALAAGAQARDLPPAALDILGWPRMTSPAFGCLMEKTFGHRDPRFNCALTSVTPGDPCRDTVDYYAGPAFPPALATRIHPLARAIALEFEHGELRSVSVVVAGTFSEAEMLRAFGLADKRSPPNIASTDVQACGTDSTCLLLTGFDHLGAADAECPPATKGGR